MEMEGVRPRAGVLVLVREGLQVSEIPGPKLPAAPTGSCSFVISRRRILGGVWKLLGFIVRLVRPGRTKAKLLGFTTRARQLDLNRVWLE